MHVPVPRLVDGVVATLIDAVLPDLATPYARAQLWAAVDVLRNLRDRVEERTDLLAAEADAGETALRRTLDVLLAHARGAAATSHLRDETRDAGAAEVVERALAGLPAAAGTAPAARAVAVRAALVAALAAVDALAPAEAAAARVPLAEHLGAQAMRDVAPLKPSLLREISRG